MSQNAQIVMDAVRAADHDRYLTALYAPADKRDALFSLYAFNAEIAGIRDRIHEPLPGEVRLQWWRDVVAAGGEAGAGHPVADSLNTSIAAFNLPKPAFDNMLDARIAFTWRMNPYLVFGLGYRSFSLEVDSRDPDSPGFVDMGIDGALLFMRASM